MTHFMTNAKAYAALVGAICTGLLGVYAADTPVGQILTVVSVVATALVTWTVPNATQPTVTPQILGKAFYGGTFSKAAEDERRNR